MLTTRWQPLGTVWPEINRLQEEMQQWLRRAGMNDPRRSAQSVYPPLNLWEDDNNLCDGSRPVTRSAGFWTAGWSGLD